jgi:hypothetical protein
VIQGESSSKGKNSVEFAVILVSYYFAVGVHKVISMSGRCTDHEARRSANQYLTLNLCLVLDQVMCFRNLLCCSILMQVDCVCIKLKGRIGDHISVCWYRTFYDKCGAKVCASEHYIIFP